jgi:Cellulase N-terminal ig-like domain
VLWNIRRAAITSLVLGASSIVPMSSVSADARAHVRVNQVGYVADRAKQAFVLSTTDHEGQPFELIGEVKGTLWCLRG